MARKRTEPERINLDDWGNAGALEGLLSFLNIKPENAPVHQSRSIEGTDPFTATHPVRHNSPGPDIATQAVVDTLPVSEIQNIKPENAPVHQSRSIEGTDPFTATQSVIHNSAGLAIATQPVVDTLPVSEIHHPKQATGFGNKRIYRCEFAEHGHSHTEEALYQILWRAGKPESPDSRIVIMGYGEMSKKVRLSFNNTKYACQRLIAKAAVEEIAREVSDIRQGKTYRVFSPEAIVTRRKARGMEWVIKSKGVEFVVPLSGRVPLPDRDV